MTAEEQRIALIARAREVANGTTKVALLWSAALAVIWLFGIEPVNKTIREIRASQERTQRLIEKLEYRRKSARVVYLTTSAGLSAPFAALWARRETVRPHVQAAVADARTRLRQQQEQLAKLRKSATVTFKAPGFEFGSPPALACLVWTLSVILLLAYLLVQRGRVLNLVARAMRADSWSKGKPIADGLPWWIAPLPHTRGRCVESTVLGDALGWKVDAGAKRTVVTAILLAVAAIQLRVVYTTFAIIRAIGGHREKLFVPWLVLAIAVGAAMIVARWLIAGSVPDHLPNDRAEGVSRRTLIGGAVAMLAIAAVGPAAALTRRIRALKPRYRTWSEAHLFFRPDEIADASNIALMLSAPPNALAAYLSKRMPGTARAWREHAPPDALVTTLCGELNAVLREHNDALLKLASASMKPYTKRLASKPLKEREQYRLRRLVLCDAYPTLFARPTRKPQRTKDSKLLGRPSVVQGRTRGLLLQSDAWPFESVQRGAPIDVVH